MCVRVLTLISNRLVLIAPEASKNLAWYWQANLLIAFRHQAALLAQPRQTAEDLSQATAWYSAVTHRRFH